MDKLIHIYEQKGQLKLVAFSITTEKRQFPDTDIVYLSLDVSAKKLGSSILDVFKKIKVVNPDQMPSADEVEKAMGYKNWNSFIKKVRCLTLRKTNKNEIEISVGRRVKGGFTFDGATNTSCSEPEKIGELVKSLLL